MLGEKIYETTAKITGRRVLPDEGFGPSVEVSFEGTGKVLGLEMTEIGTYTSFLRADAKTLCGEGQGIAMSKDGEVAKWHGFGVGKPGKGLGASYRYTVMYETPSKKLARLNEVLLIGEWEVDENGNAKGVAFEWK
jgi:hypothetical protein